MSEAEAEGTCTLSNNRGWWWGAAGGQVPCTFRRKLTTVPIAPLVTLLLAILGAAAQPHGATEAFMFISHMVGAAW